MGIRRAGRAEAAGGGGKWHNLGPRLRRGAKHNEQRAASKRASYHAPHTCGSGAALVPLGRSSTAMKTPAQVRTWPRGCCPSRRARTSTPPNHRHDPHAVRAEVIAVTQHDAHGASRCAQRCCSTTLCGVRPAGQRWGRRADQRMLGCGRLCPHPEVRNIPATTRRPRRPPPPPRHTIAELSPC